jgi:ferredoxin--NADP+ reductase
VFVDARDVEIDPLSRTWLEGDEASTTARKNVDILRGYAGRQPTGKRRRIVLRFLVSPVEILGTDRVEGIRICRNELHGADGAIRARPTEHLEEIPCTIVFRSIGYRGIRLPDLPFDERTGTVPNEDGRIIGGDGRPLRGQYVVGWIKRGPTGIIGTNKRDAQETVDALLADLDAGLLNEPGDPDRDSLEALLAERKPEHVTYAGWAAIDAAEKTAGEPHGRPRVKLTRHEELLQAAREGEPAGRP